MAVNDANNGGESENRILNNSFDKEFQTLVFQPMGFDGRNLQRTNASNMALQIEYDGSSNPIYIGLASPGTAVSDSLWQIRKLTFDGSNNVTSIKYADGSPNFSNVWSDRAALTYV